MLDMHPQRFGGLQVHIALRKRDDDSSRSEQLLDLESQVTLNGPAFEGPANPHPKVQPKHDRVVAEVLA